MELLRLSYRDDPGPAWRRDGCVVVTDLFAPGEVAAISAEICGIFEAAMPDEGLFGRDLIGATYRQRRETWRACARQMNNSLTLMRAAAKPELASLLKRAGLARPAACLRPEARIDVPRDTQYTQPWHQDWRSGQGSWNAVTIWLPLHDVAAADGAIELVAGSHLWGLLDSVELQDPRRFVVADPRVEAAPRLVAELAAGECALFSQMLVHRSGQNFGIAPRLTCQLRYADLAAADFVANRYAAPTASELVWTSPPGPAEMRRVYSEPR